MRSFLVSTLALAAMAGSALAADLPSDKAPPVVVAPPPAFSWTGFYIGGDIGVGWGSFNDINPAGNFDHNAAGVVGGGHVGYNYQINQFVVGIQGDFLGSGISNTSYYLDDVTSKRSQDWLGSVNGRLGFAYDRALFYAIGGVAFSQTSDDIIPGAILTPLLVQAGLPPASVRYSRSWTGYDVGGGIEYALTSNWTGRVEYRYYDFGNWTYPNRGFVSSGRSSYSDNTVTVGLTYLFNAPSAAPVVAKY